jgi:glucose/arabinose dehydrogenase
MTPPDDIEAIGITRPSGLLPLGPKGFAVSLFATGAGNARWLAVAPNGDVFMAASAEGKIMMMRDTKGKGVADKITTFAAGFSKPHGMAFHDGAFYVADVRAIWRLPYRDGDTALTGEPKRVTTAPDLRLTGNWTRDIAFDSEGKAISGDRLHRRCGG